MNKHDKEPSTGKALCIEKWNFSATGLFRYPDRPMPHHSSTTSQKGGALPAPKLPPFTDHAPDGIISVVPIAGIGVRSPRRRSARRPLTIQSPVVDASPSALAERLLTVPELASLLQISRAGLYRLVEGRRIPFIRLGGLVRFVKADVERFLVEGRNDPI